MGLIKGVVTQGGADTTTQGVIDTNLTTDGKSAWQITNFVICWANMKSSAGVDSLLEGILSTQVTTATTFNQSEEIARVEYTGQLQGVAANFLVAEQIKQAVFIPADRITVQPFLYVTAASAATGQANVLYYAIEYEIVKLSDNEVLRLALGGA
ncbi:MAG: hypothetical protein WAW96_13495 [Alphaproteobacteria bacterium]